MSVLVCGRILIGVSLGVSLRVSCENVHGGVCVGVYECVWWWVCGFGGLLDYVPALLVERVCCEWG